MQANWFLWLCQLYKNWRLKRIMSVVLIDKIRRKKNQSALFTHIVACSTYDDEKYSAAAIIWTEKFCTGALFLCRLLISSQPLEAGLHNTRPKRKLMLSAAWKKVKLLYCHSMPKEKDGFISYVVWLAGWLTALKWWKNARLDTRCFFFYVK